VNQVSNHRFRLSATRPHLVLHAERRPFDKSLDYEQKAAELFATLSAKSQIKGNFSQFVGFMCSGEETYICLPKVFRHRFERLGESLSDRSLASAEVYEKDLGECLALARLLRKVLDKYRRDQSRQQSVDLLEAYMPDRRTPSVSEPVSHLMLAQLILQDYQRHGLWFDQEQQVCKAERGLIHWKRTVQRGGELWAGEHHDELRPVYMSPMVSKRKLLLDHPITQAQIAVLHEIALLYGPLLSASPIHLPPMNAQLRQKSEHGGLAKRLQRALPTVFQARPRRLADLLLRYLKIAEFKGKKEQVDVFGTTSFHTIFEYMCAQTLMNQDEPQSLQAGEVIWDMSLLPVGLRKEHQEYTGSSQRIDLITEVKPVNTKVAKDNDQYIQFKLAKNNNGLLILDAKYYDIVGSLKNNNGQSKRIYHLPGIEDIRKQYAYKAWVKKRKKQDGHSECSITNGLLFPTCLKEGDLQQNVNLQIKDALSEPFQRLGQVGISGEEPLYVLGLDLKSLMQTYVQGDRYGELWLGKKLGKKLEEAGGEKLGTNKEPNKANKANKEQPTRNQGVI
jgi:hypothetical protein